MSKVMSHLWTASRPLWAKSKSLGGQLGQDNTAPEMSLNGTKGVWMSPCESVVRSLQNSLTGKPFYCLFSNLCPQG